MEHLDLDGKKYMKVSSAARETGYTADYIGQLCRAKKIDAKLVGRTWYVAADEITDHRRTRGRSSHEKVRQNVQEQLTASQETHIPIRQLHTAPHRKHLLGATVTYHKDESELIPTVMSVKVDVASSDTEEVVSTNVSGGDGAHHVGVRTNDAENDVPVFKPAEKSEVKWNGTIVVEPLETEVDSDAREFSASNTVPTERHIKMKFENERNNKPNLVISNIPTDPLEAKKRFLERMNLAHELNTPEPRHTAKAASKQSNTRTIAAPEQVLINRGAVSQGGHRLSALALSGVAVVGVFFLIATTFLENSSEYRAASGTEKGVFSSTFRVSSFESAQEILSERISGSRLLSQISLF